MQKTPWQKLGLQSIKIRELSFEDLNQTFKSPIFKPEGAETFWDYTVPLVEADHVTDEAGTGFVHIAPSHGAEDFEVFLKRGWLSRMTNNVEDDSSFASLFHFLKAFKYLTKRERREKVIGL